MEKTIFNQKWLVDYDWVRESKGDKRKALCYYCKKTLDLSKMGESALKLHMKGEKHQFNYKSGKSVGQSVSGIQFYLSPTATTDLDPVSTTTRPSSSSASSTSRPTSSTTTSAISNFSLGNSVLSAEILWTLKTVTDHSSYKSNDSTSHIFKTMFPDSQIASKFTCGERKTAYLCVFGIAP